MSSELRRPMRFTWHPKAPVLPCLGPQNTPGPRLRTPIRIYGQTISRSMLPALIALDSLKKMIDHPHFLWRQFLPRSSRYHLGPNSTTPKNKKLPLGKRLIWCRDI